jgi:hypothetical protein
MKKSRALAVGVALTSLVLLVSVPPVGASDMANFETEFATDVRAFGVGFVRGTDAANITVANITGPVSTAYLFWAGPANTTTDENINAAVTVNGTPVTGTSLGFTDNNCWGFQSSIAYRADVTSLVTGNGTVSLTDIRNADPLAEINGFSLYVFFDDGDDTNNRDVVIFNGNDSNQSNAFDADGWNATLPGINYSGGTASLMMTFADTQIFEDDDFLVNGQVVADPVAVLNGSTVEAGTGSPGLWDNQSYNIQPLLVPGDNTVTLSGGGGADCVSLIVAAVNLPAGAAPNQPPPTEPPTTEPPTTQPPAPAAAPQSVQPRFTG